MKNVVLTLVVLAFVACSQPQDKEQNAMKKNEIVENILSRRSIRAYQPEQIKKEQLDTIINCAVNAPSARNYQPWEVRVIQNPELLKVINTGFNDYSIKQDPTNEKVKEDGHSIFYHAPTLIVIAKDTANPYADFDCGLLSQNILLSAHSMGIGSVCLGWLSRYLDGEAAKDIVNQLNIPATHKILIVIGLGYPDEDPQAKPRELNKVQYID